MEVKIKGGGISGAIRKVFAFEATTPNSIGVDTIFLLKFTATPTITLEGVIYSWSLTREVTVPLISIREWLSPLFHQEQFP